MINRCANFASGVATGVASGVYAGADYAGDVVVGVGKLPARGGELLYDSTRTISGLFFTSLSVLTFGKVDKFNGAACSMMDSSYKILPTIYLGVLGVINNQSTQDFQGYPCGIFRREVTLSHKARDLSGVDYNGKPQSPIVSESEKQKLSFRIKKFMKEHVASRGMYALATVVAVISRVADFIIGILAAALSILCLGKVGKINSLALENLTIFGVLDDISNGLRACVNPMQDNLEGYRFINLPSVFRKNLKR